LGLIMVYRVVGGGWEYRLQEQAAAISAEGPAPLSEPAAVLGIPEAPATPK
jgi:hypothetical protein